MSETFDTIGFVLDSYVSTEFDEAAWRALYDKAGMSDYLERTPSNFLTNPKEQLEKCEEGKPCLIFLLRPETLRDKVKHIVNSVTRDFLFEPNTKETHGNIASRLIDEVPGPCDVVVGFDEVGTGIQGAVFYKDGEDYIELAFTISSEGNK